MLSLKNPFITYNFITHPHPFITKWLKVLPEGEG